LTARALLEKEVGLLVRKEVLAAQEDGGKGYEKEGEETLRRGVTKSLGGWDGTDQEVAEKGGEGLARCREYEGGEEEVD